MEKIKKLFTTTSSRNGSYSVGLIALVIAIAIVVNLIAAQLPESVRSIDVSDNGIYEISETSQELLQNLDEDITFTLYAEKSSTDEILKRFLNKYTALSDRISVTWVDPVLHPSELTENGVTDGDIVISCPATGKSKIVNVDDILVVDEYYYYYYGSTEPTEFDGEGQFTGAINYVTSENPRVVYYTSGHGEAELSSSVLDLFGKNNLTSAELNLLMQGDVPEDCDLLLMDAPLTDFSEAETEAILSYMNTGGQVLLLLSESLDECPNLEGLLQTYGIQLSDGYIADMQRCYQGNYFYIFPEIMTEDATLLNGLQSGTVLMVDTRGLVLTDPERDTITVEDFLTTSSESYDVTEETEELDDPQTFVLGAVATESVDSGEDTDDTGFAEDAEESVATSRFTVLSSETLINSEITDSFSTLENLDLFMNTVLAGFDDMDNVAIEAKSLEVTYNTMQYTGLIGILMIVGIPALVVAIGFVRWWRRRKA